MDDKSDPKQNNTLNKFNIPLNFSGNYMATFVNCDNRIFDFFYLFCLKLIVKITNSRLKTNINDSLTITRFFFHTHVCYQINNRNWNLDG